MLPEAIRLGLRWESRCLENIFTSSMGCVMLSLRDVSKYDEALCRLSWMCVGNQGLGEAECT